MKLIRSVTSMHGFVSKQRKSGKTIGFVPTMGYLHEGHLSLMRAARRECDVSVISIFVNPAQFSPREDLRKYPRDLRRDMKLARSAGVDVIFYPNVKTMYPDDFSTFVNVERLTSTLCAASRPGHFRGVTTVVTKLFNAVGPDITYFGQKDAQQAIVIKRMIRDLDMPIKIKIMPTIREPGGLAMSSRNKYLSIKERRDALILYASLRKAKSMVKNRIRSSRTIISAMRRMIREKKSARIEYISCTDIKTLKPVSWIRGRVLIALAVRIGKTRLIDNVIVNA